MMNLITNYMTNNDCYKAGRKITPRGIMVHTTATHGVMAQRWYDAWNKAGVSKCVHAFLDDVDVVQYLPWNHRGWHAGGSANSLYIGFEICETKEYNEEYFNKAYNNAIGLAVFLCKQYGLNENNILGHYEGFKKGIASNHSDPTPYFSIYGKSMNGFRNDVKARLNGITTDNTPTTSSSEVYRIIVNGVRKIALTGYEKSKNYALANYSGDIVLQNTVTNEKHYISGQQPTPLQTTPTPPPSRQQPKTYTPKPKVNQDILNLQKALNRLGFVGVSGKRLVEDGINGANTKYACKSLQRVCGIAVDGIAGKQVWGCINEIFAKPLLKVGSRGTAVRYVQYRVGSKVDGIFGQNTKSLGATWQKKNGLVGDGIFGVRSWAKMIG